MANGNYRDYRGYSSVCRGFMTLYPTPVVLWPVVWALWFTFCLQRVCRGHNISRGRKTVQEDLQRVLVLFMEGL